MAIISSSVVQGSEIKTSDAAQVTYIADKTLFTVAGVAITQRQSIAAGVGFLAAWLLKQ